MIATAILDRISVFPTANQQTRLASFNPYNGLSRAGGIDVVTFADRERIDSLRSWGDNWDGFGSKAPEHLAIANAIAKLIEFAQLAESSGYVWRSPRVSASECGEVVLEWWHREHKLTVYIGSNHAEYIKVWGADIVDSMEDGALVRGNFLGLWRWLNA